MTLNLASAKLCIGLAIALAASIAGNLFMAFKWGGASGSCEARFAGAAQAAEAKGKQAAAEEYAERAAQIAADAVQDREDIFERLEDIADRGQQTRTVYRDRIREIPAATCAPGAERMEAANAAIGGE